MVTPAKVNILSVLLFQSFNMSFTYIIIQHQYLSLQKSVAFYYSATLKTLLLQIAYLSSKQAYDM